jgi:cytochrome c553
MSHSGLHIALVAALAFATQGAFAQGAPKPPADKAPDVQEKGPPERPHPTVENFHAQCIGCHGIPGYKTAFPSVYHVPRIAGQQPGYIVAALKEYKSGARSHPSMRGIAASLSEDQMQKLAEYYGAPAK